MPILLVEPDEDSRLLVRLMLEGAGEPGVRACATFAQALDLLALPPDGAAVSYRPELLILAAALPGADGLDACRQFLALPGCADVPVLITSPRTDADILAEAFAAGAMDFLRKPFDAAEVRMRVRNALRLRRESARREARETELAGALDALSRDLEAAAELQRSLLPGRDARFPGVEAGWRFRPCATVGGDLLNIVPLGPRLLALYLLDVAGHGVPAALQSVGLARLLSGANAGGLAVDSEGHPRCPAQVASLLNESFCAARGPMQYLTMIYGTLDLDTREFAYVQAGHPGLVHGSRRSRAAVLADGDLPVGLFPQARFERRSLMLQPGDQVLLYSDGVIEAVRPADAEPFGQERLLALADEAVGQGVEALLDGIEAALGAWTAPGTPADDVSLLALEVH